MTQNKTESVRFYYNGLRVNGERKLTRCCYTLDNRHDGAECVTIYATGYDDLPRDIFPVENDSDSYTDYFEHDRATLFPDHPLYKFARYAAMKANACSNNKSIERVSKKISGMSREPWAGYIDALKADIARWQRETADFNAAEDPGQPTAADVEACHALRVAEENARREKEHEEELQRREKALNEQNNGRRFIEQTAAEHPIEEGQPVVRIHWSEYPAFYSWKDDELVLSALIRLLPDDGIIGMASDLAKNGSPETARYVLLQLAQRDKKKAAEAARSLGL